MIRYWRLTALLAFAAAAFADCGAMAWTDEAFDHYFQRKDTVTLSAGNAHQANTVTHMIDPWPPRVRDTRIPANGERMSHVIARYRNPPRLTSGPAPVINFNSAPGGNSAGGANTGQ
jgi:hypothetical protein